MWAVFYCVFEMSIKKNTRLTQKTRHSKTGKSIRLTNKQQRHKINPIKTEETQKEEKKKFNLKPRRTNIPKRKRKKNEILAINRTVSDREKKLQMNVNAVLVIFHSVGWCLQCTFGNFPLLILCKPFESSLNWFTTLLCDGKWIFSVVSRVNHIYDDFIRRIQGIHTLLWICVIFLSNSSVIHLNKCRLCPHTHTQFILPITKFSKHCLLFVFIYGNWTVGLFQFFVCILYWTLVHCIHF